MKKRIISLTIILTIILTNIMQVILPVVSRASSEVEINVSQKDSSKPHKVTIELTSSRGSRMNILQYAKGNYDSSFFDNYSKSYDTAKKVYSTTIDIDGDGYYWVRTLTLEYGEYTFCVRVGDQKTLYHTTIKPITPPEIVVSNVKGLNAQIYVNTKEDSVKLNVIKIGKRNSVNQEVDFSQDGTLVLRDGVNGVKSSESVNFNAPSKGIYDIYAEDVYGNSSTLRKQVFLPEDEERITIDCLSSGKSLLIRATDSIVKIAKMKIAKSDDITAIGDFSTKGVDIAITPSQTIEKHYEVNEAGNYKIYAEDELGYSYMLETTIEDEDTITFLLKDLEIGKQVTAQSSKGNITKFQKAFSENDNEAKDNLEWEDMSFTSGQSVTGEVYKLTNTDLYAYVYAESDQSKSNMISFLIPANATESDSTPPTITLAQDTEDLSKINVNVKDELNNLSVVKYASGEQDESYFDNDGTELQVPDSQKEMSTSFTISDVGTYTVYAEDSKGNGITEKITVDKISEEEDTTGPTITTEKEKIDNSTIRIKITATDDSSSIKVIKVASNERDISYFSDNGTTLDQTTGENSATAYVDATSNGTYTIYAEDSKGNGSISSITITEIDTSGDGNNTSGENNTTPDDNNTPSENNTTPDDSDDDSSSSTRDDGIGKTKVQTISADDSSSSSSKTLSLPYTGGIKSIVVVLIAIISIFGIVEYKKYQNIDK